MADKNAPLPAEPEDRIEALLAEYLQTRTPGQPLDRAALLQQHPEQAAEIAAFFEDYDEMDRRFSPLRRLANSTSQAELHTLGLEDTAIAEPPRPGSTFGDYDLVTEIARGGMGVVYKARQRSLNRIVALKMVLDGRRGASTDRTRFLAEARAVARLSHPHIVPIYEVGERERQPYFTMQFVSGGSLRDRAEEFRGDERAICQLLATVARAVEHAHRRGILHRDLKPSNVLLDEKRQPHVTDFGLAKRLDEESDLTQAGAIIGTPSYMAPEQANGQTDLTTAVDVYGLGAVLYDLLTGRPPFKAATPMETLLKVMSQEPQPPRQLVPSIDPDLETICLKCLEKDPLRRYGSAEALADDLDRFLAGQPIQARKVTAAERTIKWARRQPLLAGSLATTLLAATALLVIAGFLWRNAELRAQAVQDLGEARGALAVAKNEQHSAEAATKEQQQIADEQRKLAERQKALAEKVRAEVDKLQKEAEAERMKTVHAQQELEAANEQARRTIYAADMQLASSAWQSDNLALVQDILKRYQAPAAEAELRGFEWQYLNRQLHSARLSWSVGEGSPVLGLAISPDAKTLSTAHLGGKLNTWSLADGKLLKAIDVGKLNLTNVAIADEGRKLTAVVHKGNAFDFNIISKSIVPAAFKKEKFTPRYLTDVFEFRTWNLSDDKPPVVEPFDPARLHGSIFPILSGSCFVQHEGELTIAMSLCPSPDGRFLAVSGMSMDLPMPPQPPVPKLKGGKVLVWDTMKKEVHAQRSFARAATAVGFTPSGETLAVGFSDGAIELFDSALTEEPKRLSEHRGQVYALNFTGDAGRLASAAADGHVLLWDVAAGAVSVRLRGHTMPVSRLEIAPDGETLVSGSTDGTIKVWDLNHTGEPPVLRGHQQMVASLSFTGKGDELISADSSGTVKRWNASDGKLLRNLPGQTGVRSQVVLSPRGSFLAWADPLKKGEIVLQDLAAGGERRMIWKDHYALGLIFSQDEKFLAAGSRGTDLAVWNVTDGNQRAVYQQGKEYTVPRAFSADGKTIATTRDRTLVLWDWESGESRTLFDGRPPHFSAVAFSADDSRLASAGADTMGIWDLKANRLRAEFRAAGQLGGSLIFTPDGRRLVTAGSTSSQQGLLKFWDSQSGREVFAAALPRGTVSAIALSPDGQRLAAAVFSIDPFASISGLPTPADIYLWDATPVK